MLEFEFIYFFAFMPIIIFCLFIFPEKKLAIYFPQTGIFNNIIKKQQIFVNSLKFLIFTTLIIALASPVVVDEIIIDNNQGYEISLIIDASGSMEQQNKFSIVKNIVTDFIKQRKGDKLALSIFADFAYTVVPLTYDKKSVAKLWDSIKVGIAGTRKTALYEALFLSSSLFDNSQSKERIAILLTDGVDNAKSVSLNMAIEAAVDNKIKVYTIGIGGSGDFNPEVLKNIAQATDGKYFSASSGKEITAIYQQINKLEKSQIDIEKYNKKAYFYKYPLGLSLFLSLIYFWRKNRWNLNK